MFPHFLRRPEIVNWIVALTSEMFVVVVVAIEEEEEIRSMKMSPMRKWNFRRFASRARPANPKVIYKSRTGWPPDRV